ncbi:MAG TPA: GNAT family N-acetyltransferase [Ktedonobacteraceae bacterium]|nr:GNAT family N-acetyltransferase [Ktedonobacteraceae bacterium]
MTIFRPALEADLRAMYEVFYQTEILDNPHPPEPGDIPSYLHHVLQTGAMYVAELDGSVLAFAGAITRGNIAFLTDLFVLPARQSSQLGKTLLRSVLPQGDLIHCTVSSSDPRALALYIRAGMRPQWPYFVLQLGQPPRTIPLASNVEIIEADADDPELVRWDAQIGGRSRHAEHSYWVRMQRAIPFWFRRRRQTIGYGYIRLGVGTLWHPHISMLGPIGVSTPEDAAVCTLALVKRALEQTNELRIEVPGPHPCLPMLLELGLHIVYVDTFVSTAATPFFDARCYIPSGGDLL